MDSHGLAWVREGVWTAMAWPGQGAGCGLPWLGLGQGAGCGLPWLGLGQGGGVDRRGSAWVREGVGTPMAMWIFSH